MIDSCIEEYKKLSSLGIEWELRLRLFCELLSFESYSLQKVNKGNSIHGKVISRKIDRVLRDLYKELNYLEFNFSYAHRVRNALSHANFHELTEIVNEEREDEVYNQVVSLDLSTDKDVKNLGKRLDYEELVDCSAVGLFLRSMSNEVLQEVNSILYVAIDAVNVLTKLKSESGEHDFFSKLFVNGEIFEEEDFVKYSECFSYRNISYKEAKEYLIGFYPYAKLKK